MKWAVDLRITWFIGTLPPLPRNKLFFMNMLRHPPKIWTPPKPRIFSQLLLVSHKSHHKFQRHCLVVEREEKTKNKRESTNLLLILFVSGIRWNSRWKKELKVFKIYGFTHFDFFRRFNLSSNHQLREIFDNRPICVDIVRYRSADETINCEDLRWSQTVFEVFVLILKSCKLKRSVQNGSTLIKCSSKIQKKWNVDELIVVDLRTMSSLLKCINIRFLDLVRTYSQVGRLNSTINSDWVVREKCQSFWLKASKLNTCKLSRRGIFTKLISVILRVVPKRPPKQDITNEHPHNNS